MSETTPTNSERASVADEGETGSPHGILKNAKKDATYKKGAADKVDAEQAAFDRQKVIENTRMNSRLTGLDSQQGDLIRKRIAAQKKKMHDKQLAEQAAADLDDDHLRWDEKNILLNEQEKSATMKIDEPKTPYEGGFDPNNEYYKPDDEEVEIDPENAELIDDIDLGEGIADDENVVPDKQDRIEVVRSFELQEAAEREKREAAVQEVEETAEEKHRRFEEKRKQHYHMKGSVLKHHPVPDDDDA